MLDDELWTCKEVDLQLKKKKKKKYKGGEAKVGGKWIRQLSLNMLKWL